MRRRALQQQERPLTERLSRSVEEMGSHSRYQDPVFGLFVHNQLQGGTVVPGENGNPALYKEADGNYMLGMFDKKTPLRSKDPKRLYLIEAMFQGDYGRFTALLDQVFHPNVVQKKGSPLEIVTLLAAEQITTKPGFMDSLLKNGKAQLHPQTLSVAYAKATAEGEFYHFNELLRYCLAPTPLRCVGNQTPELPVDKAYIKEHLDKWLCEMYKRTHHKELYACMRIIGIPAVTAAAALLGATALGVATTSLIAGACVVGAGVYYKNLDDFAKVRFEYTIKTDAQAISRCLG